MTDNNPFQTARPSIDGNDLLRLPQIETYAKLKEFARSNTEEREVGIVLPVGCGKSGCITLAPFAFRSKRTLVVAPGVKIAEQLYDDFHPAHPEMFYVKRAVLPEPPYPEPIEIRGKRTNRGDLDEADVAITNIHQLQGDENRWLTGLPPDYFDLIIFDEGHHSVAASWETLKTRFPDARILNFSATPLRADGQRMAGRILYSYPIYRAIQAGYVKRLKAVVLNPQTLKYVRREDGQEIEVSLEEVRRLGEQDADFRRSIVTSSETLTTIVDASIRELQRIRSETGDQRHAIIASALNREHCRQIVEAYRARNQRVEYVHSQEDSKANDQVMTRLAAHELDAIVQVRKLGEGFNHPFLSVAAVFSVFANLSPFVQFVGRIMRVIEQNSPGHVLNQGSVVFHAGANVARRWQDFQEYSDADQEFFDQLLPMEDLDFNDAAELEATPRPRDPNTVEVREQSDVVVEEIPLIEDNPEAMSAIETLRAAGYSPEDIIRALTLTPIPTTKADERAAARESLDTRIRDETGRLLGARGLEHQRRDLDTKRLGRTNFVVVKSTIDRHVNAAVDRPSGQRHNFTRAELDTINHHFDELVSAAEREVFDG